MSLMLDDNVFKTSKTLDFHPEVDTTHHIHVDHRPDVVRTKSEGIEKRSITKVELNILGMLQEQGYGRREYC